MNKFLKTINVKLLILAFYLFQCLSISAGEIDFGVSQNSFRLWTYESDIVLLTQLCKMSIFT